VPRSLDGSPYAPLSLKTSIASPLPHEQVTRVIVRTHPTDDSFAIWLNSSIAVLTASSTLVACTSKEPL
jgi:hypothetical protein